MLALQRTLIAALGVAVVGIFAYRLSTQGGSTGIAGGADATLGSSDASETVGSSLEVMEREVPVAPFAPSLSAVSRSEGLPTAGQWRGRPNIADIDGDGNDDIVASVRRYDGGMPGEGVFAYLGDGKGNWTVAVDGIRRDMGYGGSDVADLDGDGDLEIGFSAHDTQPQVFRYDGDETWSNISDGIATTGVCSDVAFGDVDGDGKFELAALGFFADSGGLKIFASSDAGEWTEMADVLPIESFGAQVRMVDIDGDGRDEVLAATSLGPRVWHYEAGEFIDRSEGLPAPEVLGADLIVDAYDFDADGHCELLVGGMIYEGHAPLRSFRWNGSAWEKTGASLPNEEAIFDLEIADVDGDGTPEIVCAGRYGILVATMAAPGEFAVLGRIEGTEGVINVAVGDIDGNGIQEILFAGFGGVRLLDITNVLRSSS